MPNVDCKPDAPDLDPAEADRVLETCRRAGVEPVSRERAAALTQEWAATFARGGEPL